MIKKRQIKGKTLIPPASSKLVKAVLSLVFEMSQEYEDQIRLLYEGNRRAIMDAQDDTFSSKVNNLLDYLKDKYEKLFNFASINLANILVNNANKGSTIQINNSIANLLDNITIPTLQYKQGVLKEALTAITEESASLFKTIPAIYHNDVQKSVMNSIANGQGFYELKPFFEAHSNGTKNYAKLRTMDQSRKAFNNIAKIKMQSAGINKFEWQHTKGALHPRILHEKLNKKVFSFDDPPYIGTMYGVDIYGLPGQMINCFTGSTKVSIANGCRNIWRYWHEGDMINLVIGDEIIECTFNHPILTNRGWLTANEIKEGDYLVSCKSNSQRGINTEIDESITTFENLFIANATSQTASSFGTIFDFHGDIPDSDIDSIVIDNYLPIRFESIDCEKIEQLMFSFADSIGNNIVFGADSEIINPGFSSICSNIDPISDRSFSHSNLVSFTPISEDDSISSEDSVNNTSGSIEVNRELQTTRTGIIRGYDSRCTSIDSISLFNGRHDIIESSLESTAEMVLRASSISTKLAQSDPVIKRLLRIDKKFISKFSGHVYTMESYNGWYSVTQSEIISKNCRCTMRPVILED
jgi:hypothetical protein